MLIKRFATVVCIFAIVGRASAEKECKIFESQYNTEEVAAPCQNWPIVHTRMFITGLQKSGTTVIGHWIAGVLGLKYKSDCRIPTYALKAAVYKADKCKKLNCAKDIVVDRLDAELFAEDLPHGLAYGDGSCWDEPIITKYPDHGDALPHEIKCLNKHNVPIVFIVRDPYDWVRSQCNRLKMDCTNPNETYHSYVKKHGNVFKLSNALYWQYLVGKNRYTGRACDLDKPLIECFADQWVDNLRNAITWIQAGYDNVYIFDYDIWMESHGYEYGHNFMRQLATRYFPDYDIEKVLSSAKATTKIKHMFMPVGTNHKQSVRDFFGEKVYALLDERLEYDYRCYLSSGLALDHDQLADLVLY
jgi:hypothetical protein